MTVTVEQAYAEVERLTRARARNFAYGIMVLPRPKRRAIAAIYAFAREVDDIADGDAAGDEKRARLEELHGRLDGAAGRRRRCWVALADARAALSRSPAQALHDLVDGGLQDSRAARYDDFDELRGYCRHVAGAVGVACIGRVRRRPAAARRGAGDRAPADQHHARRRTRTGARPRLHPAGRAGLVRRVRRRHRRRPAAHPPGRR